MQETSSFQVVNASAGSGKTFTLVKSYLKILLGSKNPNKFKQILAVTFTNKAAGEMKERVIQTLNTFSKRASNEMSILLCTEMALSEDQLFDRSKRILEAIFRNYGSFNIITIDSFTHNLIRTFAYDLKLPMNFEVELDAETLLNDAVDIVISKIGEDEKLTKLLVDFAFQKMDADKSWDISGDLKSFSKLILNENNSSRFEKLKHVEVAEFVTLRNKLQKNNSQTIEKLSSIGQQGTRIIENASLTDKDFYYSLIPKHFKQLENDCSKAKYYDQSKLKERIEEGLFYAKSKPDSTKATIEAIIPELLALYSQSEKLFSLKTRNELIIDSLNPMAVLNHIYQALEEVKQENNVLLNAEFNEMIANTIKDEPAPFIYERIGEKFRYYFIDEMQDTSVRQWQNLIPLAENALSSQNELGENGKLLMVGDPKQAIYRWRGGKAEQYIDLATENISESANPFHVKKEIVKLNYNYRSYSEIIDFNNRFFKFISKALSNETYRQLYLGSSEQLSTNKNGGFVQLSFLEKESDAENDTNKIPAKVQQIINELDGDFQLSEICVLVRTKKQGIAIANFLSANGIDIISSETLLINNSAKVRFIIDLLHVVLKPTDKEAKVKCLHFLYRHLQVKSSKHAFYSELIDSETDTFFSKLSAFGSYFNLAAYSKEPFYERIEYIIQSFMLSNESDAYLQFFLDEIYEFQLKNRADTAEFLEYWDLKKEKLSIVAPETANAVRIMTIHKSKGLEFPVVIYPYDMEIYRQIDPKIWYKLNGDAGIDQTLLPYRSNLKYTDDQGSELFTKRQEELELDNINLLYVTMTRAMEQLFVITEKPNVAKSESQYKRTSMYFKDYLKEIDIWEDAKMDYFFGQKKRVSKKEKPKKNRISQQELISTAWKEQQVAVLAKSNILWDTEQGKAIAHGNLLHELMAGIKTSNDIEEIVEQYIYNGLIPTAESAGIISVLKELVNHEELSVYFDQNNQVMCEREIMTRDKEIIIPDRLVLNKGKTTIIDYKTGKQEKKHEFQLEKYGRILSEMGYKVDRKLLVYINEKITVKPV